MRVVRELYFDEYKIDLNAKCVCGCMEGDRIHNIYRFPNDYGASVVSAPRAEREARGTFRVYILHYDSPAPEHSYEIDRETPLTDDYLVVREEGIDDLLQEVYRLPPSGQHHGCQR